MEPNKDLNTKLKEEVNKIFEDLFKKIGNNRQQLANKVIGFRKEINKELTNTAADSKREVEIRREVAAIEKMAAQQLPHLERIPLRPVAPAAPIVAKTPAPVKAKTPVPTVTKTAATAKTKASAPAKAKAHAPAMTKAHEPAKGKKKK